MSAETEALIAEALSTDEGRRMLAQAMVEPIRRPLEYQSIGRRILSVDAGFEAGDYAGFRPEPKRRRVPVGAPGDGSRWDDMTWR